MLDFYGLFFRISTITRPTITMAPIMAITAETKYMSTVDVVSETGAVVA